MATKENIAQTSNGCWLKRLTSLFSVLGEKLARRSASTLVRAIVVLLSLPTVAIAEAKDVTFDFNAGLPAAGQQWEYHSSDTQYGRIETVNGRMRMDVNTNRHYNLNEAILTLDLSGESGVNLSFSQTAISDEIHPLPPSFTGHHNGDGVSISADGTKWYRIVDASALGTRSTNNHDIDLDNAVATIKANHDPSFEYTSTFKIKFQQYDNYKATTDGRDWDDIRIWVMRNQLQEDDLLNERFDFASSLPVAGQQWEYHSSDTQYGRIEAVSGRMRMDVNTNGHYNLNEAILTLDLSGASGANLFFSQTAISDEIHPLPPSFTGHHNGDGVSISADGTKWYRIVDASALGTRSTNNHDIDLDNAVATIKANHDPSFEYTSTFKIKFQQYDNYKATTDGRDWDDIRVRATRSSQGADTTPPVVVAPADITREATGQESSVNLGTASATDSVDGGIATTPDTQGPFAVGLHNITWSATDAAGNTGTATQTVTIRDTTAPQMSVPADLTIEATGNNTPVNLGVATAVDLVDGSLTPTANNLGPFSIGLHTIIWSVTDNAGNRASATQTVSIVTASSPGVTYYHNDFLGSPIAATNESGNLLWREQYEPFGSRLGNEVFAEDMAPGYIGKAYDQDLDLSYMNKRWYDPMIGRFMAIDPVAVVPEEIHHFNRYTYSYNNPYRFVDPNGDVPIDTLWDAASIVYDIGKIGAGHVFDNSIWVAEGGIDLASDVVALAVPYLPAGSTKLARLAGNAPKRGGKWSRAPKSIQDQMTLDAARKGAGS
ncbi:MAG: RHS repeat-associated core domain-containing protein, partial [Sedimenticola sp.]